MAFKRSSGVLLHPTSLPDCSGIGTIGKQAYKFVDWLAEAGQSLWQVLPLGPTGYGNSPYAQRSAFAGNEMLISPELLYQDGYLKKEDLLHPDFPSHRVDFQSVSEWKMPRMKRAGWNALYGKERDQINEFRRKESFWIEDYALFMVLYEKYQDARWHTIWDKKEGWRDKGTLERLKKDLKNDIDVYVAMQYLFSKQMTSLLHFAHQKELKIIGDIPIFAGADSADTWSHLELFKTDSKGHYSAVSGVPPDNFSATGQLWGNPVYDWNYHKETDYKWWTLRIEHAFSMYDVLRIDHFRGFDEYYCVPFGDKDAKNGHWEKGPGLEFFKRIKEKLGEKPIIAEDLGLLTDSVRKLVKDTGFPGMKVLEFAFSTSERSDYLPYKWDKNCVAYTGTHDNETLYTWFDELSEDELSFVTDYLDLSGRERIEYNDAMIRLLLGSVADTAIIPMQDWLGLDCNSRINTPSTLGLNWKWRLKKEDFSEKQAEKMRKLTELYER